MYGSLPEMHAKRDSMIPIDTQTITRGRDIRAGLSAERIGWTVTLS